MKKILFLTAIISGLSLGCLEKTQDIPVNNSFGGRNLNVEQAQKAIAEVKDLQLIDVRSSEEWQAGHIAGAKHIPITEFESRVSELDKNKPLMTYCAAGGRSNSALNILDENGFKDTAHMKPGMRGWQSAGAPVSLEKGE